MSSKLPLSSVLTIEERAVPVALKNLREAANGPRGAEPLTARRVAELCGVELKTVHNWAAEGLIPHFRTPGRHLRFQPADVVQFLEQCGYAMPAGPGVAHALVVAAGPLHGRIKRKLRGVRADYVTEPLAGLLMAGRLQPDAIIVESDLLTGLSPAAYIGALRKALPNAKILCLGPPKRTKKSAEYQVVPTGKLTLLRELLGLH